MSDCKNNLPFSNIKLTPSYGCRTCAITWNLSSAYNNDKYAVNIYKSRDGYTDWFKLNDTPIDAILGLGFDKTKTVKDASFINKGQMINWHYKLELVKRILVGGEEEAFTSVACTPAFGIYLSLDEAEYSTLRSMLENETLSKDTIKAYILRPKGTKGRSIYNPDVERANNIDYLSQQQTGISTDLSGFGQPMLCGYSNPILTEITIKTVQNTHTDDPNGQGTTTSKQIVFDGLSYPRLIKGDLIIIPETDERYAFDTYQSESLFKGIFPFKFTGVATLLPRNQIEYKINVNDLQSCCI